MRRPRTDPTVVAAVVIPVLALLLAMLAHTEVTPPTAPGAPEETALSRSTVICPPGGSRVSVASVSGVTGSVDVQTGGINRSADLAPGLATELRLGRKPAVVTGRGDLAPGLVAARFDRPLTSVDCQPPSYDQWFTGVGAGAKHRSVLQLVNPDAGRAVVDIVVLGRKGPVDVPELRSLAVRGGESRSFDLAEVIPRRDDLALHVRTVRGRISASVFDRFRELGAGQQGQDGMASQPEPRRSNLLLGLPGGTGQRTLVLANPGDDEARATIRLVTATSVFAPQGVDDVVLPAQSVVRVPLARVLRGTGTDDEERPYGFDVGSTAPITAGLTMFVEGDLALGVPTPALTGPATTPLPPGDKEVVLGGVDTPGVVSIDLWDGRGEQLESQRHEVTGGRGYVLDLPAKARLMTLTPERTPMNAVVLASGEGATLVRVREPVLTGLVPAVSPGLP